MSTFSTSIEIGSMDGGRWERFEALVDTGSSYTAIPRDVLSRLGVRPRFRRRFRTADERVIEREVGSALARLDGQEVPTLVVFAEEGGQPLLGAVTLEEFGLGVDPLGQRLIPVEGLAKTSFYGAARTTEATLEVRRLLEGLVPGHGDLLDALHRIQHHYGYIPRAAIPAVAQHLRITEARVYGAVSFYSEFRETPPPETTISWCSGPACFINGSENIKLVLESKLGCAIGESTPDNKVGLHMGQCNGTCDNAPQVWVNGKVVGPLTAAETVDLVRQVQEGRIPTRKADLE
jgi:NADH:ubiquinone oxidoreductase subunit E/predicted aspartyl protease